MKKCWIPATEKKRICEVVLNCTCILCGVVVTQTMHLIVLFLPRRCLAYIHGGYIISFSAQNAKHTNTKRYYQKLIGIFFLYINKMIILKRDFFVCDIFIYIFCLTWRTVILYRSGQRTGNHCLLTAAAAGSQHHIRVHHITKKFVR